MCRLAAYLGPAIPLGEFLLQPPHSLMEQAWAPRELKYAKINADGYGFGWFTDTGSPAVYVNPMPIWSDPNLKSLSVSLQAPVWIANVRSATHGLAINHANTQPFENSNILFLHNGFIQDFSTQTRFRMEPLISETIRSGICGTTDSEYLFALFRQLRSDHPGLTISDLLRRLVSTLEQLIPEKTVLLNLLVADRDQVVALRGAMNHECPSLYFSTAHPDFPGGQLIASERFDDHDCWQTVPEHHLLRLAPGQTACPEAL